MVYIVTCFKTNIKYSYLKFYIYAWFINDEHTELYKLILQSNSNINDEPKT